MQEFGHVFKNLHCLDYWAELSQIPFFKHVGELCIIILKRRERSKKTHKNPIRTGSSTDGKSPTRYGYKLKK